MSEITENTLTSYLGPEFQTHLIWQLLVEPEFAEKIIPSLAVEYFDDPNLKRLFIIILEFYKEFGKVPNLQNQSIYQAINKYKTPNNYIEEESLFSVIKKINLWNEMIINKQMLYNGDVIQKTANNFIKQQEYRKLAEYILEKTKNGEIKSKFIVSHVEDKFQKITHIGEENDDCEEVFENIDRALRKEFRQTIPTGVDVIDTLTGGGLGKGEIGLILTPSGVGKSTLLTKIANTAYEEEKNVAQIIFEDTQDQIKRKHYAIWSGIPLSKMDDEEENIIVSKKAYEKAESLKGKGRLIIKRFSQENTTIKDIRNWMLGQEKKYGFKFDLLVLDYLDCLESHKNSPDRNENELAIIKGFEALVSDFDIPGWTALQTGRTGFDSEFIEAHHTGGSIKRVQKAHFFMSVGKTPDQKEAGLANIRIIKARFAKDGQTFPDCIFDNDKMEIVIRDDDNKYGKLSKGLKHHDEKDIAKLENKANKLNEISSDIRMHEAINRANSDSILGDLLTSYNKEFGGENKFVDILNAEEEFFIDVTKNVDREEINKLLENPNKESFELEIELNENQEIGGQVLNTFPFGVAIGNQVLNSFPSPTVIGEKALSNFGEKNIGFGHTPINIDEVENNLIDPDEAPTEHIGIHEMLKKARNSQGEIKKE